MKFSVGHLEYPKEDDEQFNDELEAEAAAIKASRNDSIWAVWDNESGEVLSIVYQEIAYH